MKREKWIILLVLCIFIIGISVGSATASHTFKASGCKYKMSTKTYNKMKHNAKKEADKMSKTLGHKTSAYDSKFVKATKYKKVYIASNGKLNKKYVKKTIKMAKKGWKYVKTVGKGKTGYQLYKKKVTMKCKVEYYDGHYSAYAIVF